MYETKDTNSKSNPEKEEKKPGGITIPDFKIHYKAVVIKTVYNTGTKIDKWMV